MSRGIDFNRLNGPQRKILREAIGSAFRRSDFDMFLVENDFDSLEDLAAPSSFRHQLFEVLGVFANEGRLGDLVVKVQQARKDNPHIAELEQRLTFADKESEAQRVVGGRGLEKIVRDAGFADLYPWASGLMEKGHAVCRIGYVVPEGSVRGTGFLVGEDTVLTAYHVIARLLTDDSLDPHDVEVRFGYAEQRDDLDAGAKYALAESWLLASSPYSEADLTPDGGAPGVDELDFALLRLEKPAGNDSIAADRKRGWIDLDSAKEIERDESIVFVLQHPMGKPLKQSIGIVQPGDSPLRLRYDADTEGGSSGGLVLDQRLQPIALHHAGDPLAAIKATYNQGIPLPLIRDAIEKDAIEKTKGSTVS